MCHGRCRCSAKPDRPNDASLVAVTENDPTRDNLSRGLLYLYRHTPALLHVSVLYFGYAAVAFAIPSVFFRLPGAIESASKRR